MDTTAYRELGHWGMMAVSLGFVGLILAGGFWLKSVERKTREREKPTEHR